MNYQNMNNQTIVSYYSLKGIYPNTSIAKDGTEIIIDYHVIATTPKPTYDVYTERVEEVEPIAYTQTWIVISLTPQEITDLDDSNRALYEDNMTNVMLTAQVDALGDPAVHRYAQGMTRYTSLIGKIVSGGTLTVEETDYMDGAEYGLTYQEANAISFSTAKADLLLLAGQAILDYPMPDFTMSPVISAGYQPYLDYLNLGHI